MLSTSTDAEDKPQQVPLLQPSPRLSSPRVSITESELAPEPEPDSKAALAVSHVQEKDYDSITSSQPQPQLDLHLQRQENYDPSVGAKPCSPFYRHATVPSKLARLASQRKRARSIGICSPIDDIEGHAAVPWQRLYNDETGNRRESKLWEQKKRRCDCLSGLRKEHRMAVKIVVAVVIVGSMVAIALGITAAVGGGVWSGDHQTERLE